MQILEMRGDDQKTRRIEGSAEGGQGPEGAVAPQIEWMEMV
jgi:hypothetical protein